MTAEIRAAEKTLSLPPQARQRPKRVLAVVDSENSGQVLLDWLIRNNVVNAPLEVILLSVVPRPETVRSRGILHDKVRQHLETCARDRLDAIDKRLSEAGIPRISRIELADESEVVLRCAREAQSDLIIMTAKPLGAVRRFWLAATGLGVRSPASQVAVHAEVPVLILRQRLQ